MAVDAQGQVRIPMTELVGNQFVVQTGRDEP